MTNFKSIQIDDNGTIHQVCPFNNQYQHIVSTKELVDLWKRESDIREKELTVVKNKGCYIQSDML